MLWWILQILKCARETVLAQVNKKDGVTINWYGVGGKAAHPDVNEADSIKTAWEHARMIGGWTM